MATLIVNDGDWSFRVTHSKPNSNPNLTHQLCSGFEQAWLSGEPPKIQEFLDRCDSTVPHDSLFQELLRLDIDFRQRLDSPLSLADYLARFPEFKSVIYQQFDRVNEVSATHSQTNNLAATQHVDWTPAAPSSASPASFIGRYQLQEQVGRGGFGEVWRAHDPELDRTVAVKLPRLDKDFSKASLEQFAEEARRVSRVKSKGIVQMFDVGRDDDRIYIVSEFVSGGTLKERMNASSIGHNKAVDWLIEIADALHQLHLNDIVHRDLKPQNVLIDNDDHALITDFGLAVTEREQLQGQAGICGTWAYMSPEQSRGESDMVDGRSDIYSLGVVMYELLTGRLPFIAQSPHEYMNLIVHRPPRPLRTIDDSIPVELESICLACLEKDVAKRPTTAADVSSQLQAWCYQAEPQPVTRQPSIALYTAIACCAVVLCILALGAITIRDLFDRKITSPPIDSSNAAQYTPLRELAFPKDLNSHWRVLDTHDAIHVNADGLSLIAIGKHDEGTVEFNVDVERSGEGYFGVFFGYSPADTFDGFGHFQTFRIRDSSTRTQGRHLWHNFHREEPGSPNSIASATSTESLNLKKSRNMLTVRLVDARHPMLLVNGKSITFTRPTPDQQSSVRGYYGIYTRYGSNTYSRFRINGSALRFELRDSTHLQERKGL